MTALSRRSSLLLVLVLALACLAVVLALSAQQASAGAYHSCSLSSNDKKPNKHGPTYLKSLRVKNGPSCAGAKDQVRKWFNCRTAGSKTVRSRCYKKIDGYTCNENRRNEISTSFDASVICAKGSKRVQHKYQQLIN